MLAAKCSAWTAGTMESSGRWRLSQVPNGDAVLKTEEEDNSRQKDESTGTDAKCNVCVRHSDESHLVGAGGLRGSHETGKRGWAGLCQAF